MQAISAFLTVDITMLVVPSLQEQLRQDQLQRYGQTGKRSLKAFIYGAWLALHEEGDLIWHWHLDCIVEHLEALYAGQIKRLAIALPPRTLKSTIVSQYFPAWVWIQQPYQQFLTGSYVNNLAVRDTRKSRELMLTPWYQQHYGDSFSFTSDQNVKGYYENNRGGKRIATCTDGSGTGEGGDYIVVDDAHNVRDVHSAVSSEVVLDNTLHWYDKVLSTRKNDVVNTRQLLVGQRVHQRDLIGHVLKQSGEWVYVCLAAEYEESRAFSTPVVRKETGKPWVDPRQAQGELLFPARLPREFLEEQKVVMGMDYFPQYLQYPTGQEGSIIKYHYLRRYEVSEDGLEYLLYQTGAKAPKHVLKTLCRRVISEDLANSADDIGCLSVFLLWDITPDYEAILLGAWWDKVEGPDSEAMQDTIIEENKRGLYGICMEDVGTLKSAIQRAQRKGYPVIAFKPTVDKIARANSIGVYFRAGMFYFPMLAAWLTQYEEWLCSFPRGDKEAKDIMDATSILLAIYQGIEPMMRDFTTPPNADDVAVQEYRALEAMKKENPELAKWLLEQDFGEDVL